MPKKHLREKYHLTSKLNIEPKKKLVMFGALLYVVQRAGHKENWSGNIWRASKCGARREWKKRKWSEKLTIKEVLERIGEKKTLLNNILREKIGHFPRRNCLLNDDLEGQMTEMIEVGNRTTQLLDDLRNKRRYLSSL